MLLMLLAIVHCFIHFISFTCSKPAGQRSVTFHIKWPLTNPHKHSISHVEQYKCGVWLVYEWYRKRERESIMQEQTSGKRLAAWPNVPAGLEYETGAWAEKWKRDVSITWSFSVKVRQGPGWSEHHVHLRKVPVEPVWAWNKPLTWD